MDDIDVSVVIPAFNEGSRIASGLGTLMASIDRGELGRGPIQIIVVDDGSSDDTAEQASKLLAPYPNTQVVQLGANQGKGAATRAGVAHARGAVLVLLDMDMAVHPSQIPLLLEALEECDIAVGSRSLPGSRTEGDTLHRVVMGRSFSFMVRKLFRLPVQDTQCGFKAYATPVARLLFHFLAVERFAFEVDLMARADRWGLRVAEVPVHWTQIPGSRIRPVADPVSMLTDLVRIKRPSRRHRTVTAVDLGPTRSPRLALDGVSPGFGRTVPVLEGPSGDELALLPLMGEIEVARIMQHFPEGRRLLITEEALDRRSPLSVAHQLPASDVPPS